MRSRTAPLVAVVAVLGLLAGLGAARLLADRSPQPAALPVAAADERAPAVSADPLEPLPAPGPPVAVEAAVEPRDALEGYLVAEARGDYAASYDFLAADERAEYRNVEAWVQAHSLFWPITAFRIDRVTVDGDRATAETVTGYDAGLDPVIGLIPARGRNVWALVAEDGGWRVAVSDSTQEPRYPPDASAADVAAAWAAARAACDPAEEWEVERSLVGTPALAERLCDAGPLELGDVEELREIDDVGGLVAAYGPEVVGWARVVRVASPEAIGIVLAPVGADWRVMGVIGPGLGAG